MTDETEPRSRKARHRRISHQVRRAFEEVRLRHGEPSDLDLELWELVEQQALRILRLRDDEWGEEVAVLRRQRDAALARAERAEMRVTSLERGL